MNSLSDNHGIESGELDSEDGSSCGINMGHIFNFRNEVEATHRMILVQWINGLLPSLCLPINIMDDELRARLSNGYVLCQILSKLVPGSVSVDDFDNSVSSQSENVNKFLKTMDRLGLPHFKISDLQKGSMKAVVDCLLTLRAKSLQNCLVDKISSSSKSESPRSPSRLFCSSPSKEPKEDQKKLSFASKFQRVLRGPIMIEPSPAPPPAPTSPVDQKFQEVFQLKHGSYADLSAAKISEMMKSNSLDNVPTQSLLSLVNGILEESIERKNGDIPHRLACLLRRVVEEIERRVSTQTEHLRTQNNLFKARQEKYQSRIKVLDALASGTKEESEIGTSQLQQLKTDKTEEEEKKKANKDVIRLMKDQEDKNMEISMLKQELETTKKLYELQHSESEAAAKGAAEDVTSMMKDQDDKNEEISRLKQELETTIKTYELRCSQFEAEAKGAKMELEHMSKEYKHLMEDLRNKEASCESKYQNWAMKKRQYQNLVDFQFRSLQQLKVLWGSIKQEIMQGQSIYSEEFNRLGVNLKLLADAAENYHALLAENRRLFNEVQELKGNIRVYCRIRPFISGQKDKRSIVEHIGENELVVANPSKLGKDALRSFKFNKVYGPATTQVEVYSDIQPFIRSVLDGYNVCIFAYGQTGSGKTYTMSGPNNATTDTLGVNYRALNDLFSISKSRTSTLLYEIGVQMVEIYNEQVRDLLLTDGSLRKLGITTHSPSKGLAVPDAKLVPVKSPSDVLKLMELGLKNRAMGATAMNERSSRSHSVVSIHVRGTDLKSDSSLQGNLHLVDLAGSERVDRSEVTGDRLREAQHINKSLSALGDVIFALAQKNSHVPYRNSKLTQLLQSSLGGHAKTLMFVQLNPDVVSYSESLSTLKFAERVSGVELGAARSSKEGKDVRELMEQVASLKESLSKKDEEIERLQLLKDIKNVHPAARGTTSFRYQDPLTSSTTKGNE